MRNACTDDQEQYRLLAQKELAEKDLMIKNLQRQLDAARRGDPYYELQEEYRKYRERTERQIKGLQKTVREVETQFDRKVERIIQEWMAVNEDVEAYAEKQVEKFRKHTARLYQELSGCYDKITQMKEEKADADRRADEMAAEMLKKDQQIGTLNRLMRMNHENSSIPTSQEGILHHKDVQNNRQKSGKPQGAQIKHPAQHRPQYAATTEPVLKGPEDIVDNPEWELIDWREKRLAELRLVLEVTPYRYGVFRNRLTGEIVKAPIPEHLKDEINYGVGLKAIALILNQYCNMPSRKVTEFLREASGGIVHVSNGFVAGLAAEFAAKSEKERAQIFAEVLCAPNIHGDSTVAKVNRKRHSVTVNVNDGGTMLFYSRHKGDEAIKETPYEVYQGPRNHDGETTFYGYGEEHQECVVHRIRDMRSVMANESGRRWAPQMLALLQAVCHHHKLWDDSVQPDQEYADRIRRRYDEIIALGEKEYEQSPPPEHFKDGLRFLEHLKKRRDSLLLFLDHPELPLDNNRAERSFRCVKAKQKVGGTWRSAESVKAYCKTMTVLKTERDRGGNLVERAESIFRNVRPPSKKEGATAQDSGQA